jgi:hypothetical protein
MRPGRGQLMFGSIILIRTALGFERFCKDGCCGTYMQYPVPSTHLAADGGQIDKDDIKLLNKYMTIVNKYSPHMLFSGHENEGPLHQSVH